MKKFLLYAGGVCFLLSACTKNPTAGDSAPLPQPQITLTADEAERLPLLSNTYAVSHSQAEAYARSLVAALNRNEATTKAFGAVVVIDSLVAPATKTTKGDIPQAKVYVVGLGNGNGYVLTPGDRRVPEKILGYSDESSFADAQDNPGFNYAMECLTNYVASEIRRIEGLRGDSAYMVLCGKLGLSNGDAITKSWLDDHPFESDNMRSEPIGEPHTEVLDRVILMPSQWGQWHPYNYVITQQTGTYYPTGCVATAVAQIMNYHKHGSYNGHIYQWVNFTTYGATTDAGVLCLGQLFYDLGLPTNLNMQYSTSSSTAQNVNVLRTLTAFGYTSNNAVVTYNASSVRSEIANRRPVYLYGVNKDNPTTAHAWVVDGTEKWITVQDYMVYYYKNGNVIHQEVEVREIKDPAWGFHQNWGWSGEGNNWMAAGAFSSIAFGSHHDYALNNQMITGIRPH